MTVHRSHPKTIVLLPVISLLLLFACNATGPNPEATPDVAPTTVDTFRFIDEGVGEGARNGVLFLTYVTKDIYNLNVYDPSDNQAKFISQISPSLSSLSQYADGKLYAIRLREEPAKLISFDLEMLQEDVYEFPLRKSAGLFRSERNPKHIIVVDNAAYLLRCKVHPNIMIRVSDCLLERFDFNNRRTEDVGKLANLAIHGSIRFFGFDIEESRVLVSRQAGSDVINEELPLPNYYAFLLKENKLVSLSEKEVSKLKNETCHNTMSEVPNLSQYAFNRVVDCVNIPEILRFQKDNMLIPFVTIDHGVRWTPSLRQLEG